MAIAEVATIITSVKTMLEIANGIKSKTQGSDAADDVTRLLKTIANLRSQLNSVLNKYDSVQQEMRDLQKKVIEYDSWTVDKSGYHLQEVSSGSFAYIYTRQQEMKKKPPWYCQHCFDNESKKSVFQMRMNAGRFVIFGCNRCGGTIQVQ